jgi:hypothetical protein
VSHKEEIELLKQRVDVLENIVQALRESIQELREVHIPGCDHQFAFESNKLVCGRCGKEKPL